MAAVLGLRLLGVRGGAEIIRSFGVFQIPLLESFPDTT